MLPLACFSNCEIINYFEWSRVSKGLNKTRYVTCILTLPRKPKTLYMFFCALQVLLGSNLFLILIRSILRNSRRFVMSCGEPRKVHANSHININSIDRQRSNNHRVRIIAAEIISYTMCLLGHWCSIVLLVLWLVCERLTVAVCLMCRWWMSNKIIDVLCVLCRRSFSSMTVSTSSLPRWFCFESLLI